MLLGTLRDGADICGDGLGWGQMFVGTVGDRANACGDDWGWG